MKKAEPIINRAETGAAIDRAMDALKAMKNQLKAKKLNGLSLYSLMRVAESELREIEQPISDQYQNELDELKQASYRISGWAA